MIKNILFLLFSTVITIFASEDTGVLQLFRQMHSNEVTIQAGVGPCTRFVQNDKGHFEQQETFACVYTDLHAEIGFSIPGVQEQMVQGLKYVDYMVSDHALFNRFHRYANDRFYLKQDSHLENAMQGFLVPLDVKDLARLTVMVKTLYKEEKMPVGLANSWRVRFPSEVLSQLNQDGNEKENFLEKYFPENKDVGQMVLRFVLCENIGTQDVEKVSLAPKQSPATSFFKSH